VTAPPGPPAAPLKTGAQPGASRDVLGKQDKKEDPRDRLGGLPDPPEEPVSVLLSLIAAGPLAWLVYPGREGRLFVLV